MYLLGYSLGGDEAIWLANRLAENNITVDLLITFDPHPQRIGRGNYTVTNVTTALNFYQNNPVKIGPNTYRGAEVKGAINFELKSSDHISIVSDALNQHRLTIFGALVLPSN